LDNNKPYDKSLAPLVSIIIPTWNGLELTKNCYNSIKEITSIPYEIIFVDNGSTDGTIEWLKGLTDAKYVIKPNSGFATACNTGIEQASCRYTILLNNDTVVYPHWAEALYEGMHELNNCVIMASTCDFVGNHFQFFSSWNNIKPGLIRPFTNEVNFVCVMIDKEFWNEVKLDENYISGVEDIDYCWEAIKRGKSVWVSLMSFVHHEGSQTNIKEFGEEKMNKNLVHGWKYFAEKWGEEGKKRAGEYDNE